MRAIADKHLAAAFPVLAPQRCARAFLLAGGAFVALCLTGASGFAAEPTPRGCHDFCVPVAAKDLAAQRAQGLDVNATKLGVILWDELRQQGAPPPPPTNASADGLSVSGPGATTLISANYHAR